MRVAGDLEGAPMAKAVYSKSDPIMTELRSLLVSLPVQKIQFRFGSFQLLSLDFRYLAQKLADPSSWVSVSVDPDALKTLETAAAYDPGNNQLRNRAADPTRACRYSPRVRSRHIRS